MPIDASARPGCPGIAGGSLGFSRKPVTRSVSSTATMPKRWPSSIGTLDRRQRDLRRHVLVEAEHLLVVHLVDVIAGEHDDVARVLANDRVEVLVDRVGRALIPVLADALLRRQDLDELAELLRDDRPALADVAIERERLVLRRDEDVAESRVDAVAQDEIDDAVRPAEVHRRLGALARQRREPFAGAAGQHDYEDVITNHGTDRGSRSRPATYHRM